MKAIPSDSTFHIILSNSLSVKKYTYTFLFSPRAGSRAPFTRRLVNCFDTKSFRKWTLIKPNEQYRGEKNQIAPVFKDRSLPKPFSTSLMLAPGANLARAALFGIPVPPGALTWALLSAPLLHWLRTWPLSWKLPWFRAPSLPANDLFLS